MEARMYKKATALYHKGKMKNTVISYVKALEATREYSQQLTKINKSIVERWAGFYKKNLVAQDR